MNDNIQGIFCKILVGGTRFLSIHKMKRRSIIIFSLFFSLNILYIHSFFTDALNFFMKIMLFISNLREVDSIQKCKLCLQPS